MAKMTSAADLEQRLTFQKQTPQTDPGGGTFTAWADAFTCWGSLTTRVGFRIGQELLSSGALSGQQLVNITVRYNGTTKQIDSSWRAKHVRGDDITDYYAIKSPPARDPADYGFLIMDAMKGAPDGGSD
jgi:head-tail adaptor